jgi:hypothetical protein
VIVRVRCMKEGQRGGERDDRAIHWKRLEHVRGRAASVRTGWREAGSRKQVRTPFGLLPIALCRDQLEIASQLAFSL